MNGRGADVASFAGALAATGFAALLARACPAGCATCGTCAVTVLPTAALVGSVGVAALGTRITRRGASVTNERTHAHEQHLDA